MSIAVPASARRAMAAALVEAAAAEDHGDVPVGALVLGPDGVELARAHNERELAGDPTAHAEVLAIRRAAAALGDGWRLDGATLVVTLEPCVLCAGAILAARLGGVVFGAWDEKAGAAGSMYDVLRDRRLPRRVDVVSGVLAAESEAMLARFFAARRDEAGRA